MERQLSTGSRGGTGGEDSTVRAFLEPPVPCVSVGTGGPQNPSSPPSTHQRCQRWRGEGAVSEGLRLPRPQRARCLIKGKRAVWRESPPTCSMEAGTVGRPQLIDHRMEVMSGGIGPSPKSPATLRPFPEEDCATEAKGGVLTGSSGWWGDQGARPGEETSQASPRERMRNTRTGLVAPHERQHWAAVHMHVCHICVSVCDMNE